MGSARLGRIVSDFSTYEQQYIDNDRYSAHPHLLVTDDGHQNAVLPQEIQDKAFAFCLFHLLSLTLSSI